MPVHHGSDVMFMVSANSNGVTGATSSTTSFTGFDTATGINDATIATTFSNQLSAAGSGPQSGETFAGANFRYFTTITYSGTTTTYYAGQSSANRSVIYLVNDRSWHFSPSVNGPVIPGPG